MNLKNCLDGMSGSKMIFNSVCEALSEGGMVIWER